MSRLISFLVFLVVIAVCIGFFRGWFSMTTDKEPLSEKIDVHLKVDPDKIKLDANAIEGKAKALFTPDSADKTLSN